MLAGGGAFCPFQAAPTHIGRERHCSLADARRLVEGYVEHYNKVRLNSAIGYITPKDMLAGRQQEIHAERDRKLAERRWRWGRSRASVEGML